MSYMRVTQRVMTDRVLQGLNRQTSEFLRIQEQLTSGHRINRPADDPIGAGRAVGVRTAIQKKEQYLVNINQMRAHASETATTLGSIQESLHRVNELTLQGANAVHSQERLNYIADEIGEILETVLEHANHQANGRYVFGGTNTNTPPFEAIRDGDGRIVSVAYQGNGESIRLAVSDSTQIAINQPGEPLFQGDEDLFQTLIGIREDLEGGDISQLGARLGELERVQDQILQGVTRSGAAENRILQSEQDTEDYIVSDRTHLSNLIDGEYAETIIDLYRQQNAYQAALNAASRVLQPTLLDFMR